MNGGDVARPAATSRPKRELRLSLGLVMALLVLIAGLAGAAAQVDRPAARLDVDCVRFLDPNAVFDGEIVYADYTAYGVALDHAIDAWSPQRGFAIPFRRAAAGGKAVSPEATLIFRDVNIPGSAFKGVTATWSDAPTTITLNLDTLPPPDASDAGERERLLAVMTHETGHALGLGDVPSPGVTIRECG